MDLSPLLLRVQRAAAAAAPSEETVGSLLHLALGGGEEATPLELEAGLRALGVCICGMEVRELLDFYEFPGDDTPIIRGSALCAVNDTDPEIGKEAVLQLMEVG